MNASDPIFALRAAETDSMAANEDFANLHTLHRNVLAEMLALANTRLRAGLPDELFLRLDIECLGLGAAEGLRRCMDTIMLDAEELANDAANALTDISDEIDEARHAHPVRGVGTTYEQAAE